MSTFPFVDHWLATRGDEVHGFHRTDRPQDMEDEARDAERERSL